MKAYSVSFALGVSETHEAAGRPDHEGTRGTRRRCSVPQIREQACAAASAACVFGANRRPFSESENRTRARTDVAAEQQGRTHGCLPLWRTQKPDRLRCAGYGFATVPCNRLCTTCSRVRPAHRQMSCGMGQLVLGTPAVVCASQQVAHSTHMKNRSMGETGSFHNRQLWDLLHPRILMLEARADASERHRLALLHDLQACHVMQGWFANRACSLCRPAAGMLLNMSEEIPAEGDAATLRRALDDHRRLHFRIAGVLGTGCCGDVLADAVGRLPTRAADADSDEQASAEGCESESAESQQALQVVEDERVEPERTETERPRRVGFPAARPPEKERLKVVGAEARGCSAKRWVVLSCVRTGVPSDGFKAQKTWRSWYGSDLRSEQ